MDANQNSQNQSYWFVFREDQSNVIFSSNNFTIQNPTQITSQELQEARYIVDSGDRQYIEINEAPIVVQPEPAPAPAPAPAEQPCEKEEEKQKEDDNFWDRSRIKLLLTLCLDHKLNNLSGAKEKTLWDYIAAKIGTSAENCIKKYKNLRRTYIRLLKKKKMGRYIKWVHFELCEEIYKEYKSVHPELLEYWEDIKTRRLLGLYIDNLHRFRDPDCLQKDIWEEIAGQLGSTQYSCYHKFKNLKRAYLNLLERSRESGKLAKKWPYQHYFERIFYNYNPEVGPWNRFKTKQLLDAYAQYRDKFRNPKYQKKELWKEIATMVGESPILCDRKFRNLKQTYVKLKDKASSGRSITKWCYFKDFEAIYNSGVHSDGSEGKSIFQAQEDYIVQLLQFYVDHKDQFKDPLTKKKNIWKLISPKLRMTPEECDKKFRNLKQTYNRLEERKIESGKSVKWPYYDYFEQIYGSPENLPAPNEIKRQEALPECRSVVQETRGSHDDDQKFDRLLKLVEESNSIQRERNRILQALINQK